MGLKGAFICDGKNVAIICDICGENFAAAKYGVIIVCGNILPGSYKENILPALSKSVVSGEEYAGTKVYADFITFGQSSVAVKDFVYCDRQIYSRIG